MREFTCFFITVMMFSKTINAQFSKGTRMVGSSIGSVFFNSKKSDYSFPPPTTGYTSSNTSYGFNLAPNTGWFVSNNTSIGARLNLGFNRDKTLDEANGNTFNKNDYTSFRLGIGGFTRMYFGKPGTWLPFGQFNLDLGMGSTKTNGFTYFAAGYKETYDGKSTGDFFIDAGYSFGVSKMLNKNTSLDLYGGYLYSYNKNEFESTTLKDIDLDGITDETAKLQQTLKTTAHGFSINLGFQIFLDKKK